MSNQYHYLSLAICLAAPTMIGCELPEEIVGETAEPPSMDEPQDPNAPDEPQDPTAPDPPQDPNDPEPPQDPPPPVEPPSATPTVLAGLAGTLAVDDTWLFIGAGPVPVRMPKSGGAYEPVAAPLADSSGVSLIALDDTHVYWNAYISATAYQILRAPKLGGEATLITDLPGPNFAMATALVVDDDYVYTAQPDIYNANDGFDKLNGVVRRVPKAGGAPIDLAQVYTYSVAVSDSYVYWPRGTEVGGGELVRADKDGANVEVIAAEFGPISVVVIEGDRLFWVFGDAGQQIARTALESGPATTLFSESGGEFYVGTPAPTADGLYWLRPGGAETGGVLSVDLQGQFSELVTAPASAIFPLFYGAVGAQLAADEAAIYWSYAGSQGGAPRLYRVAR